MNKLDLILKDALEGAPEGWRPPQWYVDGVIKQQKKLANLANNAPALKRNFKLSSQEQGWKEIGMELSCVPNAVYPWDKEVVAAIRRIAPDIVPVWVRWIFKDPDGKVVVFGRHALARVNKDKKNEGVAWPVEMPSMPCNGMWFEAPNDELIIWQSETNSVAEDVPGDYKPFNWELYKFVADNYKHHDVKELKKRFIDDVKAARQSEREKLAAEQDYIKRDLDKFVDKMLDKVSESEVKDWMLGDKSPKTKPTVVVGKHS